LILSRVRQWTFVLEDLAEITAVDPAAAGRASDEMLGFLRRHLADRGMRIQHSSRAKWSG
jgi:hypothetical protein